MKVWLQRSDFTSSEKELSLIDAIKLYEEHDWLAEIAMMEQFSSMDREHCPPGMGLVHATGRILHICPGRDSAMCHLNKPKKLFGLIAMGTEVHTADGIALQEIPNLIRAFYNEQWEAIAWAN